MELNLEGRTSEKDRVSPEKSTLLVVFADLRRKFKARWRVVNIRNRYNEFLAIAVILKICFLDNDYRNHSMFSFVTKFRIRSINIKGKKLLL